MSSLSDQELLHFARQVILPEIDEVGQAKLKQAQVTIFGVGGLGSAAALYLAAAGVGQLTLIDHDRVETSNLQRQIAHSLESIGQSKVLSAAKRCQQLNPFVNITTINEPVDVNFNFNSINSSDLLLDCLDNTATRRLVNRFSVTQQIPLLSASAVRFEGQISLYNNDPFAPCYDCVYQPLNSARNTLENKAPANDDDASSCFERGVVGPVVGVLGSMQALETIKVLTGCGTSISGKLLVFDGLHATWQTINVSKKSDCPVCNQESNIS